MGPRKTSGEAHGDSGPQIWCGFGARSAPCGADTGRASDSTLPWPPSPHGLLVILWRRRVALCAHGDMCCPEGGLCAAMRMTCVRVRARPGPLHCSPLPNTSCAWCLPEAGDAPGLLRACPLPHGLRMPSFSRRRRSITTMARRRLTRNTPPTLTILVALVTLEATARRRDLRHEQAAVPLLVVATAQLPLRPRRPLPRLLGPWVRLARQWVHLDPPRKGPQRMLTRGGWGAAAGMGMDRTPVALLEAGPALAVPGSRKQGGRAMGAKPGIRMATGRGGEGKRGVGGGSVGRRVRGVVVRVGGAMEVQRGTGRGAGDGRRADGALRGNVLSGPETASVQTGGGAGGGVGAGAGHLGAEDRWRV